MYTYVQTQTCIYIYSLCICKEYTYVDIYKYIGTYICLYMSTYIWFYIGPAHIGLSICRIAAHPSLPIHAPTYLPPGIGGSDV